MQEKNGSAGLRRVIVAAVVVVVVLVGAYFIFVTNGRADAPSQPINFPHKAMVQLGITCVYCHNTALKSPAAGMPSVQLCVGCHKTIKSTNPEIQKVLGYFDRNEPIPWNRVYLLPRFVYFSHQAHVVAGGLNCETCHGDVANMGVAVKVVDMNMGWCLNCHEKQPNAAQLKDCIVCHQ
jgi:c(7)-type cytochrome triheme protein